MAKHANPIGCEEYRRITRREALGRGGLAIAGLLAGPSWLPRVAFAGTEDSTRDVIISIFLRGGCDGLTMCVPFGDPGYYAARPNLSVAPPDSGDFTRALDLDGFFGLPQPLGPLKNLFKEGDLAIVHAAGSPDVTRSHFDAQRSMEAAQFGPVSETTGWLGRHLLSKAPMVDDPPVRALALTAGLPTSLGGSPSAFPTSDPAQSLVGGNPQSETERLYWLKSAYTNAPDPLAEASVTSLRALDALRQIDFGGYVPAPDAAYPESFFGQSMKATAALLKAEIGVEAVHIDHGGWDTHVAQGVAAGTMATLMSDFAAGINAFYHDIFQATRQKVILVAMSEFGRKARENANLGTDHGHGNAMFVLGRKLRGGKVYANWPGLAPELLYEGQDLAMTTDYRDVLGEIVAKRLGNANLAAVFPNYSPQFLGLTT